jgi:putative ABC transport system permease protein
VRLAPALLVARALGRSWAHRPVRLVTAIVGGVGGVLLATVVLTIATPVLRSTQAAPVEGVAGDVVAVAARAPAGLSLQLAKAVQRKSGAAVASGIVAVSSTAGTPDGDAAPVVVLGVDRALPAMLTPGAFGPGTGRLAPPTGDGAYLSREWAQNRGLYVGAPLVVTGAHGAVRLRVQRLIGASLANGGSTVVVSRTVAARMFDRGSTVDVLLLRARDDAGVPALRRRAEAAVGGAADVVAPRDVFASYARIYRTPLLMVSMLGQIGLLVGSLVLFLTWRLALEDARPILSRMRLLGVRFRDLALGSALVLVPALLVSYALGTVAGLLVGRSLSGVREQILNFTGQAFAPSLDVALPLAGAFAATVVMFGFAWLTGLARLRRATPIDAITGRDAPRVQARLVRWPLVVGVACLAVAAIVVVGSSGAVRAVAGLPLLGGVVLLAAGVPVVVGAMVRRLSSGPTGLFVGRQLQAEWRRNAALGVTFTVALLGAITMLGTARNLLADINASDVRWTGADLYVLAAPLGENLQGESFPPSVQLAVDRVPGVRRTDAFSYANTVVLGGRRLVETVEGAADELTSPRLTEGPRDVRDGRLGLFSLLGGDRIAVSSNLARTQHVGVGSKIELPVVDGTRVGRVVAVIDDAISDGGMVMVSPGLFREVAQGMGAFYVGAQLEHGANLDAVRERLRAVVQDFPRAQVLDRAAYRERVGSLLGRLMASFTIFAWVLFVVAALVATATLASGISERARAVALARLAGGRNRLVLSAIGIEAAIVVTVAWAVAAVGSAVAIPALLAGQSEFSGLLPGTAVPADMLVVSLPLALLTTAAAFTLARWSRRERPLAQTIADE